MANSRSVVGFVCSGLILLGPALAHSQQTGSIVGWGRCVVVEQSALDSLIAVAEGGSHSLGLKSDGTIVTWGNNYYGQCNVPAPNEGKSYEGESHVRFDEG